MKENKDQSKFLFTGAFLKLQCYTIAIITAHAPGQHTKVSLGPCPAPNQMLLNLPKTGKSDVHVQSQNFVSERSTLTKFER